MQNQLPKLWERKTYVSAFLSALLTGAVAVSVCAFKGETLALDQSSSASVSDSHTATLTGSCSALAGGNQ